jgi:hypothetical protein
LLALVWALFFISSALDAAPAPGITRGPTLYEATSCAAVDGTWTVGGNATLGSGNNFLTFVRTRGDQNIQTVYQPTPKPTLNGDFNRGKCIEANDTAIFFHSDSHNGFMAFNPDGTSTWTDTPEPQNLDLGNLTWPLMALGRSPNSTGILMLAVTDKGTRIARWDTTGSATRGLATLTEYAPCTE